MHLWTSEDVFPPIKTFRVAVKRNPLSRWKCWINESSMNRNDSNTGSKLGQQPFLKGGVTQLPEGLMRVQNKQ